ncbi:hypothetical protein ACP70R_049731 [Stipagrostis hirtigluma subsp. patula]
MGEGLVRRRHSSPAPPLEVDDLLREILLRLPPLPSSLPRASLVCRRWRRLVSDPAFLRGFRSHHRRDAPLLGVFAVDGFSWAFTPTLDPPDRVPAARIPVPWRLLDCRFLGCRDGLALILVPNRREAVLWNPVTREERLVPTPPGNVLDGGVLCTSGDVGQLNSITFMLVFRCAGDGNTSPMVVRVYESESGRWGDAISASSFGLTRYSLVVGPSVLVGNALCWLIHGRDILQFSLDTQSLAWIYKPSRLVAGSKFQIFQTEDHCLGLVVVSGMSMQLQKRQLNAGGFWRWIIQKNIQLAEHLPLPPWMRTWGARIYGFAEDKNAIFLSIGSDVFVIQLESMQFRKLPERPKGSNTYYPFTGLFTTGMGTCGANDGVNLQNNT